MNPRPLLRGLLLIATLVLAGYALKALQVLSGIDAQWIDTRVRNQGLDGELLFIGAGALLSGIGVPRQLVCFLGGYAFGVLHGGLLGLLATALGCTGAFFCARLLGRELLRARFAARIVRLDDFLHEHTLAMTVLIRLLPVGNNLLTTVVAGVTRARALPFLIGSVLGYTPQTLVFALAGSGVQLDPLVRIGLAVPLFVLSGALGVWLYRRYRHGHSADESLDRELGENVS